MLSVGKLTIFNRFLEIFAKMYGSCRPKIVEKKFVSGFFKTDKFHTATKPRWVGGGGKGLRDTATKRNISFAASLRIFCLFVLLMYDIESS